MPLEALLRIADPERIFYGSDLALHTDGRQGRSVRPRRNVSPRGESSAGGDDGKCA
jgi:hypothetical protein